MQQPRNNGQQPTPPRMNDLPLRPALVQQTPPPAAPKRKAPKHLKKAPKRVKRPVSQAQRSRVASANAKEAPRDAHGRFTNKHFFEHVFDGIEWLVGGVQKAHKKVKRTVRKVRRTLKSQPRMVPARPPQQRKRKRRGGARATNGSTSQAQPGYRGRVIQGLLGL